MFDVTVVICSHNPRSDYFRRTLSSLREQTLPLKHWELLVVDNASTPPLAASWDLSWHPHARHIVESELGLAAARQCGIRKSASDFLVFIDDDNVLDETYLTRALEIKRDWPLLGVWGSGWITPEYEVPPEGDVRVLIPYLTVRKTETACWSNALSCLEAMPWGAGLCVRRRVAETYLRINEDSTIMISGRKGMALLSGEDVEISYVACHLGLGMGVFPELKLTHLISKERVTRRHLLRLYEGTATSNALLSYKWKGARPLSPLRPWGLLSIVKNSIIRRRLDRQLYFAGVRANLSARRIIASSQFRRVEIDI